MRLGFINLYEPDSGNIRSLSGRLMNANRQCRNIALLVSNIFPVSLSFLVQRQIEAAATALEQGDEMFGSWEKALRGMEEIASDYIAVDEENTCGQDYCMRGFTSTTKVATERGWRRVSDIQVGDKVFTFDNGLQAVHAISRGTHFVASDSLPDFTNPLHIPMHALGNEDPMVLLPEQVVMIESDVAEELSGDPFALITAKMLVGFRGIERFRSLHPIEMTTLHFEHDEVVYAEGGSLLLSPAEVEGFALIDVFDSSALPTPYTVWRGDQARHLVAEMVKADADQRASMQMSSVA